MFQAININFVDIILLIIITLIIVCIFYFSFIKNHHNICKGCAHAKVCQRLNSKNCHKNSLDDQEKN